MSNNPFENIEQGARCFFPWTIKQDESALFFLLTLHDLPFI